MVKESVGAVLYTLERNISVKIHWSLSLSLLATFKLLIKSTATLSWNELRSTTYTPDTMISKIYLKLKTFLVRQLYYCRRLSIPYFHLELLFFSRFYHFRPTARQLQLSALSYYRLLAVTHCCCSFACADCVGLGYQHFLFIHIFFPIMYLVFPPTKFSMSTLRLSAVWTTWLNLQTRHKYINTYIFCVWSNCGTLHLHEYGRHAALQRTKLTSTTTYASSY